MLNADGSVSKKCKASLASKAYNEGKPTPPIKQDKSKVACEEYKEKSQSCVSTQPATPAKKYVSREESKSAYN